MQTSNSYSKSHTSAEGCLQLTLRQSCLHVLHETLQTEYFHTRKGSPGNDYHQISRNFHSCGWDVFSFPGAPRIGWTAFSSCLSLNRVTIFPFTFPLKGSLPNFSFQAPFLLKLEVPDQICKILFLTKVQLRSCCDFHSVVIG